MSWFSIFATMPLPVGPMCVKRPATSAKNARARSMSAGSPPAMIVSEPEPEAGGPPETGASIQPTAVFSRSLAANALHFSTLIVEKSMTSCGGRTTEATPPSPKTACSTASVVGRLSRTRSTPLAASAGERAATAPAARAASTRSGTMS